MRKKKRLNHLLKYSFFYYYLVFKVPHTSDVVTSVFKLELRKSIFDIITLVVIISEILLFLTLRSPTRQWVFLFLFVFWRTAYDVGLGILLKNQSDKRNLVTLAKRAKIFDKEKGGKLRAFIKNELSIKMGDDYDFDVRKFFEDAHSFSLSRYHFLTLLF